jgi:acyl-coenzyme A thioesterase PaaI-like protein
MNKDRSMDFGVLPKWKFLEDMIGFKNAINLYPPYLGAGISIEDMDLEFLWIKVCMDLTFWNQNYVGVHFGGSLYSMCDPFYMFILMKNLGDSYIVWDKSAKIDFIKTGTGKVRAKFSVSKEEIEKIKETVRIKKKTDWTFYCEVSDESGSVVAKLEKILYIRRKPETLKNDF